MKRLVEISYSDLRAGLIQDRDCAARNDMPICAERQDKVIRAMEEFVNDPEHVGKSVQVTITLEVAE